ncbi:MAG TPA: NDP-sugar synthase [Candidatus Saccharimonadales bacterium]|nr:NDP-sugar synthase [Candidatus Saccharimonadales bacterium]
MQAVVLAAGKSSRFYPYSNYGHKSCVTLLGKTILEHTLLSVKKAGITDVILVVPPNGIIEKHIGDGSHLGLNIAYVIQKEPLGGGNGLLQCKDYIHGDFFLLNASRVDFAQFAPLLQKKKNDKNDAVLLGKKQEYVENFGALSVEKDRVTGIVEKPTEKNASDLRVVGIYLFGKEFLQTLSDTPPEHYQLEKAIDAFAKTHIISLVTTDKDIVSLKYPWDLLEVKNYLLKQAKPSVSKNAEIAKSAVIEKNVIIEDGAKIMEGAVVKGPAYIGKNAFVGNRAIVRDGTVTEENTVIGAGMEIKNSLLMSRATTHSGFIGDSVIGQNSKIAAYFVSGNVRLDRTAVKVETLNGKIDTHRKFLGVLVGDNVAVGIRVSTMPGVVIGNNAVIGPSTTLMKNVADNTTLYTKVKEVVEEHR